MTSSPTPSNSSPKPPLQNLSPPTTYTPTHLPPPHTSRPSNSLSSPTNSSKPSTSPTPWTSNPSISRNKLLDEILEGGSWCCCTWWSWSGLCICGGGGSICYAWRFSMMFLGNVIRLLGCVRSHLDKIQWTRNKVDSKYSKLTKRSSNTWEYEFKQILNNYRRMQRW